ncbi:hypothetical protein AURDEDRAFT_179950 [Auricularia subglabra TFB-10046 SS5]|nr:hypothetical protein AURDEDRAFT_179950 [Auricularia subglabra TFB-10046 SS5]
MAGPTLLQTLLNRPSQTYSKRRGAPPPGDAAEARVAADARHSAQSRRPGADRYAAVQSLAPLPYHPPPSHSPQAARALRRAASEPKTAPAAPPSPIVVVADKPGDKDDKDDDDTFYTPNASPSPSPDSSVRMPHAVASPAPAPVEQTPGTKRAPPPSSSASSSASSAGDLFSDYSWARSTSSATSELGDSHAENTGHAKMDFPPAKRQQPPAPAWAKDVRWLVPPTAGPLPAYARGMPQPGSKSPDRRPRQRTMPKPRTRTRMSAVIEEDDEDTHSHDSHHDGSAVQRKRSLSSPAGRSTTSSSMRTVDLLATPATSAGGSSQNGYTSLVLPLAAYTPAKNPAQSLASNKVDLPRSGIAQTTMSTISITQHGASVASKNKRVSLLGLFGNASTPSLSATPSHLRASAPSPLGFSSRIPPPSKFGSSQVLVQVWAVAVDRLDAFIVSERADKADGSGYGFVPGRGFVGRVVESGIDVSNISRGEWIFGVLEVKKCGALAEFIAVDRRRIYHIPQILQPPTQARQRRGKTIPASPPPLTLEQVAFLALAGVPAHRAVRTLAPTIAAAEYEREPDGSKRSVRALVLQAHDGVGFLAAQELVSQRVHVVAQVPGPRPGSQDEEYDHVAVAKAAGASHVLVGDPEDVLEELRDMLATGLSWNDDGPGLGEFDCVVDTVGGKGMWERAVNVMREGGQFVTTVGDSRNGAGSSLTAGAHFRHNIRSLQRAFTQTTTTASPNHSGARTPVSVSSGSSSRRNSGDARNTPSPTFSSLVPAAHNSSPNLDVPPISFKGNKPKKVRKRLGYQWISPAADVNADGEDVRDTLAEVARLAQAGILRPSLLAGWHPMGSRSRQGSLLSTDDSGLGLPRAVVEGVRAGAFKVVPFERTPDALRIAFGDNAPPIDLDTGGVTVDIH